MIRVHLLRELGERRLTLKELQRRTGVSYSGLHALASGQSTRADFATLDKICTALDCPVAAILEHAPEANGHE